MNKHIKVVVVKPDGTEAVIQHYTLTNQALDYFIRFGVIIEQCQNNKEEMLEIDALIL